MPGLMNHCRQCSIQTDSILCPGCNRFLVEDPLQVDAFLMEPPAPPVPFGWATAFAHWGDTVAALSIARQIMARTGQETVSVLYLGATEDIGEFLEAQPWIDRVVAACPRDVGRVEHTAMLEESSPGEWLRLAADVEGLPDPRDVWPTGVSMAWNRTYRCRPVKRLALPAARRAWAEKAFRKHRSKTGRTFLLHPRSTASESAANHWPHWRRAVEWLLEETPHTYLLTGLETWEGPRGPRLVDMIGQTPTQMEVFALAELCDGVISTCNSLSLWTVVAEVPGLICGNRAICNLVNYFRRFIDRPPNTYIGVDEGFERFTELASLWLEAPAQAVVRATGERRARTPRQGVMPEATRGPYYRIIRGIVSGKRRDHHAGAIVEASDLNGAADVYVGMGMAEMVGV